MFLQEKPPARALWTCWHLGVEPVTRWSGLCFQPWLLWLGDEWGSSPGLLVS